REYCKRPRQSDDEPLPPQGTLNFRRQSGRVVNRDRRIDRTHEFSDGLDDGRWRRVRPHIQDERAWKPLRTKTHRVSNGRRRFAQRSVIAVTDHADNLAFAVASQPRAEWVVSPKEMPHERFIHNDALR